MENIENMGERGNSKFLFYIILVLILIVIAVVAWYIWGDKTVVQDESLLPSEKLETSVSPDSLGSINSDLQSIDVGDLNADFQEIDGDINSL